MSRMKQLRMQTRDYIALALGAMFLAVMFVLKRYAL